MMKTVFCKSRGRQPWAGFTLLELVVVLLILSILATIAIQMIEPQVDQARFEATQKTIQNVDNAIIAEKMNTDGTHYYSGFLTDIGRLPAARFDSSGSILTLSELWLNPGVAGFRVRRANQTEGGVPEGQEDEEVLVPSGWNGPYLQLPIGATTLTDGWGTQLATAGSTYSHLRSRDNEGNEIEVTNEGNPVYGVRSLGRHNEFNSLDTDYDRDVPRSLRITTGRTSGAVVHGNVTIAGEAPGTEAKILIQLLPRQQNSWVNYRLFAS